jgi:hypothetical protein
VSSEGRGRKCDPVAVARLWRRLTRESGNYPVHRGGVSAAIPRITRLTLNINHHLVPTLVAGMGLTASPSQVQRMEQPRIRPLDGDVPKLATQIVTTTAVSARLSATIPDSGNAQTFTKWTQPDRLGRNLSEWRAEGCREVPILGLVLRVRRGPTSDA